MSSNAFARSRPRVRHQRVPKTPSYAHPRFLKLVKELVRIDEAKKKVIEPTSEGNNLIHDSSSNSTGDGPTATASRRDDTTSTNNQIREQINAQVIHQRYGHGHNNPEHHTRASSPRHQHAQQHINLLCCSGLGGLNYPSCVTGSNNSHSYRSIGLNLTQTSSALHDNYYRHNSNDAQEHMQNQSYSNHHNRDYSYPSIQQDSSNQTNPSIHHSHHIDYRSLNKFPSSSSSTNASLGYSKSTAIHQQNLPQSNNCNSDLRQDENRSKRKRSNNDATSAARKCSPNPSSPSACGKRHKSSPEPPRPLSPSFTKCPICLLDCMDRDPSFTNTCFHLFCFVCIENWSKSKATCPLCRTKFSKIIYNIRSESCFEEKVASPLRRDDEDDRFTYEQLTAHPLLHPRNSHEEARLLFDNLRNNDVLLPHSVFTNQVDPRQVDLGSFNSVTNNSNFSSAVPQGPFATLNYGPMGPNYIALIPSNNRVPNNATGSAITSAYPGSVNLTSISSDSSSRPRVSRSGRYIYSRSHDLSSIDGSGRGSRSTNTNLNPSGLALDSRQHHHVSSQTQHQHQSQQQHRSTVTTIEIGPTRLSHNQSIHFPYHIPSRHNYTNPSLYSRRPYANPPMDQHILDELYPQIPEM